MILSLLIEKGGVAMWPLLGLAFFSVLIITDRSVVVLTNWLSKSEKKSLGKNLRVLGLISQISPVVGFLGTVFGIMAAFKGMSMASEISLQVVSHGMYEALYTTAAGLIISLVDSVFCEIFSWSLNETKSCKV